MKLKEGQSAPEFLLKDKEGKTQELKNITSNYYVVYFYPKDNQYLSVSSEYYGNSLSENGDNYFVNLSYQFTFEKPKMDLNISWRNILNTDQFINASNNQYYYIQSSYRLRPSQVLATLKFTF